MAEFNAAMSTRALRWRRAGMFRLATADPCGGSRRSGTVCAAARKGLNVAVRVTTSAESVMYRSICQGVWEGKQTRGRPTMHVLGHEFVAETHGFRSRMLR